MDASCSAKVWMEAHPTAPRTYGSVVSMHRCLGPGVARTLSSKPGACRNSRWKRSMQTWAYKEIEVPLGPMDVEGTKRLVERYKSGYEFHHGKPLAKRVVGVAMDALTVATVGALLFYVLLHPPVYKLGEICPRCNGKGREPCPVCRSNPGYDPRYHPAEGKNIPCPICKGTMSVRCMCCKGLGGARKVK